MKLLRKKALKANLTFKKEEATVHRCSKEMMLGKNFTKSARKWRTVISVWLLLRGFYAEKRVYLNQQNANLWPFVPSCLFYVSFSLCWSRKDLYVDFTKNENGNAKENN